MDFIVIAKTVTKKWTRSDNGKERPCPKQYHKERSAPSAKKYKTAENYSKCQASKDGLGYSCKICNKIDKTKQRAKIRLRHKERITKDPVFRLIHNERGRIKMALKDRTKSARTVNLLGCTGAECMDYLEKLFWPGMTRDNYGKNGWVADHIIPIDAFDKTDPNWQFKAFHYTNLQPLWNQDNGIKLARLDWKPQESKYELPERLKMATCSNKSE